MDLKQLRQRCEARLRALDLPVPFDVRSFCGALAARRGRAILLHPIAGGVGPFGLWVAAPSADFIFYQQETSPLHREHIILHEVCHLLCDHHPAPVLEAEFAQLLLPDLDLETVRRVLQRSGYSSDEEREAELLASLIFERTSAGTPSGTPGENAQTEGLLRKLEASLETGVSD